jgi:hypothetical protein
MERCLSPGCSKRDGITLYSAALCYLQVCSFQQLTFVLCISYITVCIYDALWCNKSMHTTHSLSRQLIFLESILQTSIHPSSTPSACIESRLRFDSKNSSLRTHIFVESKFYHLNLGMVRCRRSRRLPPVGVRIYGGCIMGNIILITDYAKQLCGECFFRGVSKCILSMCQGDKRNALPQ